MFRENTSEQGVCLIADRWQADLLTFALSPPGVFLENRLETGQKQVEKHPAFCGYFLLLQRDTLECVKFNPVFR